MEDNRIVELFWQRDETAIRLTAEKYGSRLRALAHGITENAQTAEECENDTYLQAWNSIPPHAPREYLYAFLARITRHLSLDRCRERNRQKRSARLLSLSTELEQCLPAPDAMSRLEEDLVFAQLLNAFLASLSEEKRHIFLRRYWFMDSISQISRRFGLTQSKVKVTLFRCREALRKALEKEDLSL